MNLGTDGACRVMLLSEQSARHDDDDGVHGPEWHTKVARCALLSAFRLAQRVLIANDQTGANLRAKPRQAVIGISAQNKSNAAIPQVCREIDEPLAHELIVAKIGTTRPRSKLKEDNDRFSKQVGRCDSDVQSRIVARPLRSLHPVNDATSIMIGRAGFAPGYARVELQRFKIIHRRHVLYSTEILIRRLAYV
jgi:hypothetical protein